MKRLSLSLVTLPLILAACSQNWPSTLTQDLTGTWNGVFKSPSAGFVDTPFQMVLLQEGARISGTVDVPINGISGALERYGDVNGAIAGDIATLNFVGTGGYLGGSASITVKVNGNQFSGTGRVLRISEPRLSPPATVTANRQ